MTIVEALTLCKDGGHKVRRELLAEVEAELARREGVAR